MQCGLLLRHAWVILREWAIGNQVIPIFPMLVKTFEVAEWFGDGIPSYPDRVRDLMYTQ